MLTKEAPTVEHFDIGPGVRFVKYIIIIKNISDTTSINAAEVLFFNTDLGRLVASQYGSRNSLWINQD